MTSIGRHTVELMDEDGARTLANQIMGYWRARGHDPVVTVEAHSIVSSKPDMHGRQIWVVRSNIGDLLARAA